MCKEKIKQFLDKEKELWETTALYIWDHPELGNEEYKAQKALTQILEQYGFDVEHSLAGLPTAFRARYDLGPGGPTIAFLAEYDALPELGHACGHNLIGVMAVAAGIALSQTMGGKGGTILVLGTPAEETNGGKVPMVDQGIFEEVDVAMMVHPANVYQKSGTSLALEALQFDFYGSPAHAAATPEKGKNALDALINMYCALSHLRQQTTEDVRIHGIISRGGEAANIIPSHTQARYYFRAATREKLNELLERVKECARGGAIAAGCEVEIKNYETSYDNMITNEALSHSFLQNLLELGVKKDDIAEPTAGGSIDMGNVSHVVPAIHPYVPIADEYCVPHSPGFAQAARSSQGLQGMLQGAKAMAFTAHDILTIKELQKAITEEFNSRIS